MLTLDDLDPIFDAHYTRTAFRLEVLPQYGVASDGTDVARYLAGEPDPTPERKNPWLDELRAEKAAGKYRHRVHVLTRPLTGYLRYECEWGYVPNVAAGETVRILDLTSRTAPAGLIDEEFWLLDDDTVVVMHYNADGEFLGADLANDVGRYVRARDVAVAASEDFTTWWAAHPEEHRDSWMVKAG